MYSVRFDKPLDERNSKSENSADIRTYLGTEARYCERLRVKINGNPIKLFKGHVSAPGCGAKVH